MAAKRRPRRALLDVNVLIALLDAGHIHHRRASAWLAEHIESGWASCAITQNGCIRIMSQPAYPGALPAAEVAARLASAAAMPQHAFIPADLSLLDEARFDRSQLLGHRQITDAWLLGVAVQHGLRFVTLDAALPWRAVHGALPAHAVNL